MAEYGICGALMAVPGQGDLLASHLLEAAAALQDVDDCRLYLVSRQLGHDEAVWVMEIWASQEAHEASLQLEAVQQLIARARPVIAGMGERFELAPIGGKGYAAPSANLQPQHRQEVR